MISVDFKPNHICCNPSCTKGEDGGRKKYYACDYCDRTKTWISLCCSKECFIEFSNTGSSAIPQRTDIAPAEMDVLMSATEEDVKADTLEKLAAAGVEVEDRPLSEVVEEINASIDSRRKKKRA